LKDWKSRESGAPLNLRTGLLAGRPGLALSFQASTPFAVGFLLVECLRGILCRFTFLLVAEIVQCGRAAGRMLATVLLAALLLAALLPRLLALLAAGIPVLILILILRHLELLNKVVEAQYYASLRTQQAASRYHPATMRTTQLLFPLSFRP
jgi:hypothetical protein